MNLKVKTSEIIYREDLYPRIASDPALIQRYAQNIEVLPPIEINQHNILIDGYHRWTAHRKMEAQEISVKRTETKSEQELFSLAILRNANHGLQLSESDKKDLAIRLFHSGQGIDKEEISKTLSVSLRTVSNYLNDIEKDLREKRKQKIFEMYLACYTQEETSEAVNMARKTIDDEISLLADLETLPKSPKLHALFQDEEFQTPLYNVWTFGKKTNGVEHFGNSEQRILENLLYLYTNPFDIIFDPFAGGGATIDICKKRLRRYWVSDRKPIVEREDEIRKLDIVQALPMLNKRWGDVALTYLDPPYWKQAMGRYSEDSEDLANMSLDLFTKNLIGVVKSIAAKQSKGVIALLLQPTQWNAEDKQFTDHILDLVSGVGNKKLILENRVSCPYPTQQCTPQMVEWAKQTKKLLVLSRELIIWKLKE